MSCGSMTPKFRLLDAYVGWDAFDHKNLTGLDDPDCLRLEQEVSGEVAPNAVLAYLPPPRLARSCGACEWYLLTPNPPAPKLLRRDPCAQSWLPVWSVVFDPKLFVDPVAIAARSHHVAAADQGANKVWIWTRGGEQLAAEIGLNRPGAIAFAPWGELLVTVKAGAEILRFGLIGEARGKLAAAAPGEIEIIAVSDDCKIWLVTRDDNGRLKLWNAGRDDAEFRSASVPELTKSLKPTGLVAISERGFCLEERGADGAPVTRCYSWYGRAVKNTEISRPDPPTLEKYGQLLTQAIDSGVPRCRWHRVRLDADAPPGTTLAIAVATSETADPPKQGVKDESGPWKDFEAGAPHPSDWNAAPGGSLDFLIDQPPGRYLFVRLRLTGDGKATPFVRRIRLDFPRSTSLELLPPVYRERPEAEDFTERFLSLFDASIADLDRAIERSPALLDPDNAPEEVLPWLGSFLDVAFDPAWDAGRRRKILRAVPELYRLRGTVAGLKLAIQVVFDVKEPVIQELAAERAWGGLGASAQLGAVRLFGKSRARFRLGSSTVGGAPIRGFGNPDNDPLIAQAYRFRVLAPSIPEESRVQLERLVASQKPAHTVASVHVGGHSFLLGHQSAVGVDTLLAPPPAAALGVNARLNRMSVLRPGPHGLRAGILPGATAVIGEGTIVQ
jgi:phage tail-like protein